MPRLPIWQRLRHLLTCSGWRGWLFPFLCVLPYLACVFWLVKGGLVWIAAVLVSPLLMAALLALLTFWLAKQEFRNH